MSGNWKWYHTAGVFVLLVAIFLVGWLVTSKLVAWLCTLVFLVLFTMLVGQGITKRFLGVLIDERFRISLSRMQLLLWTVVILSGYLTAALANLSSGQTDPLIITIPGQLWALMGISTTSLVGSPLIKSNKKTQNPDTTQFNKTKVGLKKLGVDPDKVKNDGLIVENDSTDDAKLSDLFKGEETGNAAVLDLAKIQMFFFSVILVFSYAAVLGNMFCEFATKITKFPALDSGMVALLGVSHAGYLTNKAIPHSKTEES